MARTALPARTRLAVRAGQAAGWASRVSGRGNGGTLPGWLLVRIAPDALAQLGAGVRCALVSGTNGKTTTTRFLHAAVTSAGAPVVTNGDGANLATGLAGTLARGRRQGARLAVLEVDELALPSAVRGLAPAVVVLLNLTRDQLDRVSEVAGHVPRWRDALAAAPGTTVVANADDPLVVAAVHGARPQDERVLWVAAGQRWQADAAFCPVCASAWAVAPGAGAPYACGSCQFGRPPVTVAVEGDRLVRPGAPDLALELALPGPANRGNAALAATAAGVLGVDPGTALSRMSGVREVAGRYSVVPVGDVRATLLLAKNPAGWSEALDQVAGSDSPCVVAINAKAADGTDPSWLWDVPFERLSGRPVVAAGERAEDLAVRLYYAGVDCQTVPDVVEAVGRVEGTACTVLANYTAFAGLRRRLGIRDGAGS